MTKMRRTEITIQTREITIFRMRGSKTVSTFCKNCQCNVQIFTLSHAALIFRVKQDFLESLFGSNQIHAVGENVICANSLAVYFNQELRFVED